ASWGTGAMAGWRCARAPSAAATRTGAWPAIAHLRQRKVTVSTTGPKKKRRRSSRGPASLQIARKLSEPLGARIVRLEEPQRHLIEIARAEKSEHRLIGKNDPASAFAQLDGENRNSFGFGKGQRLQRCFNVLMADSGLAKIRFHSGVGFLLVA
ncbi:MAG TPA: hypothetical protein VEK14_08450, partial [Rhodomicrobium sp.]|nr:hypothetical protein [Rhodomicrobium sp.]